MLSSESVAGARPAPRNPPHRFSLHILDFWIAAALVVGLIVRLINLDAAPLWLDETETAIWASLSPAQLFDTVVYRIPFGRYDTRHLPFYFGVVNAWTSVAGYSPWALRLPSVLFSLVSLGLLAALARRLTNIHVARWAAWLGAISPFLVHTAQEARMYALIGMLAAWSLLTTVRYLEHESRRLGIAFVIANVTMLATHYYAFFLVGAVMLTLLLLRPRDWRNWLPEGFACAAAVGALVFVALFLTKQSSGEIYRLGALVLPGSLWALVAGYAMLPSSGELHGAGLAAAWPYAAIAALGMIPVAFIAWRGWQQLSPRVRLLIAVVLGCTLLGPFLISLVFAKISFNPRYLAPAIPMLLTLLAAGMPRRGASRLSTIMGAALIGVMSIATFAELSNPGGKREDVISAAAWLDENVPLHEEIAVTSDEMLSLALYHWPKRRVLQYPDKRLVVTAANAGAVAAALPFSGERRIYVIGRSWLSDPHDALEAELHTQYANCGGASVRGIKILCLMRR
jgi:uncharacterized membrane protein